MNIFPTEIGVELVHPEAKMPERQYYGDAGWDVRIAPSNEKFTELARDKADINGKFVKVEDGDWVIGPQRTVAIPLGIKVEVPFGWEIQVRSRSGLAKKGLVVANSPGTIDSGWRGVCQVILKNNLNREILLKKGMRIAQFVPKRVPNIIFKQVKKVEEAIRGVNGIGSTGVN